MTMLITTVGFSSLQFTKNSADDCLQIVSVSTILYWSMIEGGLAVIAACLPTLTFVRKVSLSPLFRSLRSALSFGSVDTQEKKWYQRSPPRSKESYTHIHAGSSTSSTSDPTGRKNKYPMNNLVRGNVDRHLEPQEHGIQVTRHLSQHASMVWTAARAVNFEDNKFRTFFRQEEEVFFLLHLLTEVNSWIERAGSRRDRKKFHETRCQRGHNYSLAKSNIEMKSTPFFSFSHSDNLMRVGDVEVRHPGLDVAIASRLWIPILYAEARSSTIHSRGPLVLLSQLAHLDVSDELKWSIIQQWGLRGKV